MRRRLIGLLVFCLAAVTGWQVWRWIDRRPLREAQAAYERKDWGAAYAAAELYRRSHVGSREANLVIMRSLAQVGRCESALELSQVGDVGPDDLRLIASCLMAQGIRSGTRAALETATLVYEQILAKVPDDAESLKRRAAILVQLDRPNEALQAAAKLAALPGHARAAHAIQGTIYHGRGDYAAAATHLLKVVELDPSLEQGPETPENILKMLALDLIQLGQGDKAEPILNRLLESNRQPELLWQLGLARQQQNDPDLAIAVWTETLALDPAYLPALRDIAELELARGRPEAAIQPLERGIHLAPNDPSLHFRLGSALKSAGRAQEAVDRFREAERLTAEK